jgi:hypothetical protein
MDRRPVLQDLSSAVSPSNPFAFMPFRTLSRNGAHLTLFASIISALFSVQRRGEGVYLAHPLPTAPSPLATVSPLFATDPRNRELTPIIATLPRTRSRNSFVCHTYGPPSRALRPEIRPFQRDSSVRPQVSAVGFLRERQNASPPTNHSSHCVGHRAVPELASYAEVLGNKAASFGV